MSRAGKKGKEIDTKKLSARAAKRKKRAGIQ